ncbi:hypothetical protein EDD85DRAFT_932792 [Armillaria nabsnona]|nr:hypothetical protein EDD85DRAFT_932792 [Armillaria nabsnona]
MIPVLLYPLLCSYILPVPSLSITVPTQPHPLVNASTLVLLTWSSDDPSHFFVAVQKVFSSDSNVTSFIQPVENFIATRSVSLFFQSAGKSFIEATEASPTQANINVAFAQSEPFQVGEGPTSVISEYFTRDADFSLQTSSATVSSIASISTTSTSTASASATPSNHDPKIAVIAGVVCGAFFLALITTILMWRCRRRREPPPEDAFPTNLENDRQHIIWPYLKRMSIPPLRAFFHDESEYINHYPDVPPPPYSPLVTSE